MPTTLLGIILYIFSLAPGVVFAFAREGHHPSTKRSAIRETASIVFASTLCNGVVLLVAAGIIANVAPWDSTMRAVLAGNYSWVVEHYWLVIPLGLGALAVSSLLGLILGSERADRLFVGRIWNAAIPRDKSAWSSTLDSGSDEVVVIASVTLKSGAWISGSVFTFEADPNPNPERALVLTGQIEYRPAGQTKTSVLTDSSFIVIEASEIGMLQATKVARETAMTTESLTWKRRLASVLERLAAYLSR